MTTPISILMPCYQINDWLIEALGSVNLAGEKVNAELIIVANNMGIEQLNKLELLCSQLLTIHYRIVDAGVTTLVGALNFGLKNCQHELIARMDQDDLMTPNRLVIQRDFLELNLDHVLVGGSVIVIDEAGNHISTQTYFKDSDEITLNLKQGNCFAHPAVMYRKSSVEKVGGYSELFPHAEDFDLFVRLNRLGKSSNLDQVVLKYRVSQSQVSSKYREAQITSTKAIIILQGLKLLPFEKKFPLPNDSNQLHSWIRRLRKKSFSGLFSSDKESRHAIFTLRRAFAQSYIAIARSSGVHKKRITSQVIINLLLSFCFSPRTLIQFMMRFIRKNS